MDYFQEWLRKEIYEDLSRFPIQIIKATKTSRNTSYIILHSVCSKLCFNPNYVEVIEAFKDAVETFIKKNS